MFTDEFFSMKANMVLVSVVAAVLLPMLLSNRRVSTAQSYDEFHVKSWSMTVEEIDAAGNLYRIDLSFPEEPEERPYIEYNLKVKLQTVVLAGMDKDEIIDMILEECPEKVTGITVQF